MSKVSVRFAGELPVRLLRNLQDDEELTFPVTVQVSGASFDVETGDEIIDLRVIRAEAPK